MFAKFNLKYEFEGSEDYSPIKVDFDFPGDLTIDQFLNNIECFLKACGFHFNGNIQVVDETLNDDVDWVNNNGLEDITSPCETSTWDEQFDVTKTTHLGDSISTEEYQKQQLKNWNEGIAKLDKELKKNKWFHGLCNPPSPDWKKKKDSDPAGWEV